MYRFWDAVIKPLLDILQPQNIVEIGAESGANTEKLLEYCAEKGAVLYSIDPYPQFDIKLWEEKHGVSFVFFQALSLNALPLIEQMDLVLIDGDHNWYTVYQELKLIEKRAQSSKNRFPVTVLHDVGWPYGRRDLYYNPENIPEAFRKPYKKKGLKLESPELMEEGGLNVHLNNAIYENNYQSGVLTAVEDFINDSSFSLHLVFLPPFHGLGLLFPMELKNDHAFTQFIDAFCSSEQLLRLMEQVEKNRLQLLIDKAELNNKLFEASEGYQKRVEEIEKRLQKEAKLQAQLLAENERAKNLSEKVETTKIDLQDKDNRIKKLQSELAISQNNAKEYQRKIKDNENELQQLNSWMQEINKQYLALLDSNRWKIGDALITALNKLRFMKKKPAAAEQINNIFSKYKPWQDQRNYLSSQEQDIKPAKKSAVNQDITKVQKLTVDIVICIHNALEDVQLCLDSVNKKTLTPHHLYLVNDGSDAETTAYLKQFAHTHSDKCTLLENKEPLGYTGAANKGMQSSKGDYVVLLNSDTIVPQQWLSPILHCGESNPQIGVLGPLSNAATYQSVPLVRSAENDWAINELPEGWSVDMMAATVAQFSERRFPKVPFVNGFCYIIKRKAIDTIGYFDEEGFPNGYGEENDYSIRAADQGFLLAIVDDAYVYHARSKSYTHEKRFELSKAGRKVLEKKHGAERLQNDIAVMEEKTALLNGLRQRFLTYLENPEHVLRPLKIMWLLLGHGGGGGAHSVVQEASTMNKLPGVYAEIVIKMDKMKKCLEDYHDIPADLFYFFKEENELLQRSQSFDIVVATHFSTFSLLERIYHSPDTAILPAYYIQDYEPWIVSFDQPELLQEAQRTYTALPETLLFAKTDWICQTVEENHVVKVHKVKPSLDTNIYHYSRRKSKSQDIPLHLTAMVRPRTPRRAPRETMILMKEIKRRYGENVKVTIFGNDPASKEFQQLPQDFDFENRGILKRNEVAELLCETDIFIDMSTYQAFGRTAFEAMATGCAVIITREGGVYEFAEHMQNALIVDTKTSEEVITAVEKLIDDEKLRKTVSFNATKVVENYNLFVAAWSEVELFRRYLYNAHA